MGRICFRYDRRHVDLVAFDCVQTLFECLQELGQFGSSGLPEVIAEGFARVETQVVSSHDQIQLPSRYSMCFSRWSPLMHIHVRRSVDTPKHSSLVAFGPPATA